MTTDKTVKLSEADAVTLYWMRRANEHGVALFEPTVKRFGLVPECESLRTAGLCSRTSFNGGYWVTPAGRAILNGEKTND